LRELIEWVIRKDTELTGLGPVCGDVAALQKQQVSLSVSGVGIVPEGGGSHGGPGHGIAGRRGNGNSRALVRIRQAEPRYLAEGGGDVPLIQHARGVGGGGRISTRITLLFGIRRGPMI